jgi:VIT1/CCC1 family predicted Fe2+/Mn2+ transporter
VAPRRVLDPLERASEIVFGLLMVLTFTGSIDVAMGGREEVGTILAAFLLVFLSTLPVVIPFLLVERVAMALRLSHAVAIVMLFAAGWSVGAHAGVRPLRSGLAMVGLGLVLASVTIALGG